MNNGGSYSVTMRRREVVAAVLQVQEHWMPMSNLDLLLPPLNVGILFCYCHANISSSFEDMVAVLKKSLAQALVSFYPFAGEIMLNLLGEPEIMCNNRGVEFTQAYADIELKILDLYQPDVSVDQKLVPVKIEGVLSVQVADAYSANMFLTAWAKIARGELIMRLPSFRRSHFNPRRPPQPSKSLDKFYVPQSSLSPPPSDNCMIYNRLISRIYHMKSESIDLIQSQANNNDTRRSKIESFSAFLRKAIADGGEDHSKSVKLGIVVDGRVRLGGETMWLDRYFGNVLSFPCVEASVGKLQTMSLNEVAKTVHECISAATTEHFLGLIDYVEVRRPKPPTVEVYYKDENDEAAVVVSSGQRFPVREVDFGWGKPVFGSYYLSWKSETGYIMPMPSSCGNEDWIVYMHLKKKHLDLASHILSPFSPSHMN